MQLDIRVQSLEARSRLEREICQDSCMWVIIKIVGIEKIISSEYKVRKRQPRMEP